MKKLLIAAAVAGTMVSGVAFADEVSIDSTVAAGDGVTVTLDATANVLSSTCSITDKTKSINKIVTNQLSLEAAGTGIEGEDIVYTLTCPKGDNGKILKLKFVNDNNVETPTEGLLKNNHKGTKSNALIQLLSGGQKIDLTKQVLGVDSGSNPGTKTFTIGTKLVLPTGANGAATPGEVSSSITAKISYE